MDVSRRALIAGIAGAASMALAGTAAVHAAAQTTYRYLTVKALSRAGRTAWLGVHVYDPATKRTWPAMGRDNAVLRLPDRRTYELYATVSRNEPGEAPETTVLSTTYRLSRGHDQVTLRAAGGRPIDLSVGDPSVTGTIRVNLLRGDEHFTTDGTPGQMYVVPVRRAGLTFTQGSTWTGPGVIYRLGSAYSGGIPAGVTQHVTRADLASVRVTYRSFGDDVRVNPRCRGAFWGGDDEMWLDLPATVTEYLTPGAACRRELWYESSSRPLFGDVTVADRTYTRGTAAPETWNAAVFAPAAPGGYRTGDRLHYEPAGLLSDADGNQGFDQFTTVGVRLRQGTRTLSLGPYDPDVTLPEQAAAYRLDVSATRDATGATLSDRVQISWLFRSARTAKKTALPLTTVRFTPRGLDDRNTAAPGSTTQIPVRVVPNPGAPARAVRTLTVEASTDGGTTWRPLTVTGGSVSVTNPGSAGFVDLRATVTDSAGDQVVETVSRAYRVGGRPA